MSSNDRSREFLLRLRPSTALPENDCQAGARAIGEHRGLLTVGDQNLERVLGVGGNGGR